MNNEEEPLDELVLSVLFNRITETIYKRVESGLVNHSNGESRMIEDLLSTLILIDKLFNFEKD